MALEGARHSAEEARRAAEEARRHRDAVLSALEGLRRSSEAARAVAERGRAAASERFDATTRTAIREEVEIAIETLLSATALAAGRPDRSRRRPRAS